MDEVSPLIQIKGLRDGLLVTMVADTWDRAREALLERIDSQRDFFRGARLALDVGTHVLHVDDLVSLRDLLSDRGVLLWAVLGESPTTERTAQLLGLATRISRPRPQEAVGREIAAMLDEESALWVRRTLRSGTRVEFPGNVVIVGDVNPGAEVIAGGSVMVWGRLRGVVHAGAGGDTTAFVCALDLSPTQLRIASEIVVPATRRGRPRPEMAFLRDGRLSVEPWRPG
ncbi:MAG: septum site-determining protein MinC [Anaerolineae bacterium]|nr:MAG: septum site-determining protein MinC [Anaerolineae bacterium]